MSKSSSLTEAQRAQIEALQHRIPDTADIPEAPAENWQSAKRRVAPTNPAVSPICPNCDHVAGWAHQPGFHWCPKASDRYDFCWKPDSTTPPVWCPGFKARPVLPDYLSQYHRESTRPDVLALQQQSETAQLEVRERRKHLIAFFRRLDDRGLIFPPQRDR